MKAEQDEQLMAAAVKLLLFEKRNKIMNVIKIELKMAKTVL